MLELPEDTGMGSSIVMGGSAVMGGSEGSGESAGRESMRLANSVYQLNDATWLGCFV